MLHNKLNLDEHVSDLCKTASKKLQELQAITRVVNYMTIEQTRIIMEAHINSYFGYCPLVWMFHSRTMNNRINKIHERALRIVYNDKQSTFNELLRKHNSVTTHIRNIQIMATEAFKVVKGLFSEIIYQVLQLKENSI